MPEPTTYQFDLPQRNHLAGVTIPEQWYPEITNYWDRCTTRRSVHPINGIKAVVIHATAGASSEGAVSRMIEGAASFHWLVPDENESSYGQIVWACVPETLAAWHVRNAVSHPDVNEGVNRVNHWSLGIEIVNTQINDPFSDWQIEVTTQIVRYCWAKYPNLQHIVSHAKLDPSRRSDPGRNFPWDRFKQLVLRNEPSSIQPILATATPASRLSGVVEEICC